MSTSHPTVWTALESDDHGLLGSWERAFLRAIAGHYPLLLDEQKDRLAEIELRLAERLAKRARLATQLGWSPW